MFLIIFSIFFFFFKLKQTLSFANVYRRKQSLIGSLASMMKVCVALDPFLPDLPFFFPVPFLFFSFLCFFFSLSFDLLPLLFLSSYLIIAPLLSLCLVFSLNQGTSANSLRSLTKNQIHAELIYAEAVLLKAVMTVLHDEGL